MNPSAPGTPDVTYKDAHTHNIKADKMANMLTMYDRFISPSRRPNYLPPYTQPAVISSVSPASTAMSGSASALPRKRKQSRCTVVGCDGTGHRNKARWRAILPVQDVLESMDQPRQCHNLCMYACDMLYMWCIYLIKAHHCLFTFPAMA